MPNGLLTISASVPMLLDWTLSSAQASTALPATVVVGAPRLIPSSREFGGWSAPALPGKSGFDQQQDGMMDDPNLPTTAPYAHRFQRADADWLDRSGFRFNRNHWYRVWKSGDGKRKRSDRQVARLGAFCFDIDHAGRSRRKAGLTPEIGFELSDAAGQSPRPVSTSVLLNCIRKLDPSSLKLLTFEEARNLANHDGILLPSQVSDPGIFQRPGSRLVIEFDGSSFWGAWLAI